MARTHYLAANVDGLKISYRAAGPTEAPALLLLHGFPSGGHLFRDLIPLLADRYHLVAPDLPGFGQSEMPAVMSSITRLTISRSSRAVPAPKGTRRKFEISEMSAFKTLRKE
jgi:pimeloyl-ACP methyl ester carboxylesterase